MSDPPCLGDVLVFPALDFMLWAVVHSGQWTVACGGQWAVTHSGQWAIAQSGLLYACDLEYIPSGRSNVVNRVHNRGGWNSVGGKHTFCWFVPTKFLHF